MDEIVSNANHPMLSIQSNLDATRASRLYGEHSRSLATAVERLSSARRINSARDDAAGLAISERMNTAIRSSTRLRQGISDGISLAQVADGALATVQDLLQRARELAVQSANGTNGSGEHGALDTEFQQIAAEIDRIAGGTQIFGNQPLQGSSNVTVPAAIAASVPTLGQVFGGSGTTATFVSGVTALGYIPGGASNVTIEINSLGLDDDIQLFTRNGKHLAGTPITGALPDYVWTHNSQNISVTDAATAKSGVLTTTNGFLPTAVYDGSTLLEGPATYAFPDTASRGYNGTTISYTGDGDRTEPSTFLNNGRNEDPSKFRESLSIDVATEDLVVIVVGSGNFTATASWDQMPATSGGSSPVGTPGSAGSTLSILSDVSPGGVPRFIDIDRTPADTQSLGLSGTNVGTQGSSVAAIGALDGALDKVGNYRAQYGAHLSRFESAIGNLTVYGENMSASRGRIVDADYAQETADKLRSGILADASLAMLAQANTFPEVALNLLRKSVGGA
ncbi:flagellin [Azoarcus sp. KH32C]|uniref:flagellin N-terminal helical domain-containing protein n=1 Tax=Azoarcus sp. KH32C TaxID=748247 RepID=UPI00034583BB|nr:flagellin [Azoarcus sp. KH32C]